MCAACGQGAVEAVRLCHRCGADWRSGRKAGAFRRGGLFDSLDTRTGRCPKCRQSFFFSAKDRDALEACPVCSEPIDRIGRTRHQRFSLVAWSLLFVVWSALFALAVLGGWNVVLVYMGAIWALVSLQFAMLAYYNRL